MLEKIADAISGTGSTAGPRVLSGAISESKSVMPLKESNRDGDAIWSAVDWHQVSRRLISRPSTARSAQTCDKSPASNKLRLGLTFQRGFV